MALSIRCVAAPGTRMAKRLDRLDPYDYAGSNR
ncbi:hypothetical protein SAMN05444007_108114 [Cribrihabitans marinus]|uniref:Uncharacterized protein n=1 Tax=Cribrihabitans marinus TaxID=1227549 RepID=A0A1H7CJJ1_9RHOB|nr:hypothetical protein SAMN05444007_108114 [Cribrihabitans marinus]